MRNSTTRIVVDIKLLAIGRHFNATFLVYPLTYFLEDFAQKFLVKVGFILECEIEVLRETVCLEETFLQARATLEHPAIGDLVVGGTYLTKPSVGWECLPHGSG